MAVVYRHRRLDTDEIFYIGIGKTLRRPYRKDTRNTLWYNITKKTNYKVEILSENLSWEDACDLEKLLISEYGRRDLGLGPLVNMTNGGDGTVNFSKDILQYLSKIKKGKKLTDETKKKMSKIKKELGLIPPSQKGKKRSEESKLKRKNTIEINGAHNAKKVINSLTNEIWNSAKECAEKNNINKQTLINKLNGHRTNDSNFKYL
jgi:hypothetical protein